MALNKDYPWPDRNLSAYKKEFEKRVGKVDNIYDRNTFCSGFAHKMVIAEIGGEIFAIEDLNNAPIYCKGRDAWFVIYEKENR